MCRLSRNSGSLNLLEPQGPTQACRGVAFYVTLTITILKNAARAGNDNDVIKMHKIIPVLGSFMSIQSKTSASQYRHATVARKPTALQRKTEPHRFLYKLITTLSCVGKIKRQIKFYGYRTDIEARENTKIQVPCGEEQIAVLAVLWITEYKLHNNIITLKTDKVITLHM
jgi:hypothetical protein